MGHDPKKEPPFFFQKNPSNLLLGREFPYPAQTKDLHFEIELVVALKSGGTNIQATDAMRHVYGYAVGLDMNSSRLAECAEEARATLGSGQGLRALGTLHVNSAC